MRVGVLASASDHAQPQVEPLARGTFVDDVAARQDGGADGSPDSASDAIVTDGSGDATGDGGPSAQMSFFVTSVGLGAGGKLGGLAGADAHCRSLAAAAGATKTAWVAYLSVENGPGGAPGCFPPRPRGRPGVVRGALSPTWPSRPSARSAFKQPPR